MNTYYEEDKDNVIVFGKSGIIKIYKNVEKIKDILENENLIETLETERKADKKNLNEIINLRNNHLNEITLYSEIGIAFALMLSLFGNVMMTSNILINLISLIILGVTIGNVINPITKYHFLKKKANKVIEKIAAEEAQISKLDNINKILLKGKINSLNENAKGYTISDAEKLKNLREYLCMISLYGKNKIKFLNLYYDGTLKSYLRRKGYNEKQILLLYDYINECFSYTNQDNLENTFENQLIIKK